MVDHGFDPRPGQLPSTKELLAAPAPAPDADLKLPSLIMPRNLRPKPPPLIIERGDTVNYAPAARPVPLEPEVGNTGATLHRPFAPAAGLFPPPAARSPYWNQTTQNPGGGEAQIHQGNGNHPAATTTSFPPPAAPRSPRWSPTAQNTSESEQPTHHAGEDYHHGEDYHGVEDYHGDADYHRGGYYPPRAAARPERAAITLRRRALHRQAADNRETAYRQRAGPYERVTAGAGRRRVLPLRGRTNVQ